MSSFIAQNSMYNIVTDNEITSALAMFDDDLIYDSFINQIRNREQYINANAPNVPHSFEEHFKLLLNQYPMNANDIQLVRYNTYKKIIETICIECGLSFIDDGNLDYYSIAFYLYELMVSGFFNCMNTFFVNFINHEKNGIYNNLNLGEEKRNKDSSTLYNKRLFKNPKLAIIVSNLEVVINNIQFYNLDFNIILTNIFGDSPISQALRKCIQPKDDFLRNNYLPLFQGILSPILITNIRLSLQQYAVTDNIEII